jgi:hypothetical protein
MTDEVVSQLSKTIRGNVITPASSEYEGARKVYLFGLPLARKTRSESAKE